VNFTLARGLPSAGISKLTSVILYPGRMYDVCSVGVIPVCSDGGVWGLTTPP
jgi:hypothetical protein